MKTCLIIIDMQKGFINEHTRDLVAPLVNFLENKKFDSVVATRYINTLETACYILEEWKSCMEGSDDTEILPEILPFVERVFDKGKYSCWNDEFKDYIKSNQFDLLYFVGVNTGCCVLHSVFDAHNDVYDTRIIEDLCGSSSGTESHKAGIKILTDCLTSKRIIKSSEV